MEIPLTGLSTLTGLVVMFIAWLFVGRRIYTTQTVISRPVAYLHKFFLHMIIFFIFMNTPHILLYTQPALFPLVMAWGYVVGHIFLYVAFTYIALMTVSIIPQLSDKSKQVIIAGAVVTVVVTTINALTMIAGTHPIYDYARHLTEYNASPIVGAAIGIFASLSLLPPGVLFLISAAKTRGSQRMRSLLLGLGFVVLTVAGPLHDVARNWQSFLVADVFTIVSIILIGAGVVYRINTNLSLKPVPATTPSPAGSRG